MLCLFALCTAAIVGALTIVLDPSQVGARFDGVGAVSGGGGTRLLLDYPTKQREEILDLLFRPNHGAALHILKVEIGCDGDTTQGAEQTHMRSPTDNSPSAFDRGYETWLMMEARSRNPEIHLSGLWWGVPGWVYDSAKQTIFTDANQDYIIAWLKGLRQSKAITVDSIALGFNERGYDPVWIKSMRKRLHAEGLGNVTTIAADLCCGRQYDIANDMRRDDELAAAVDVIGTHCPGPLNGQKSPDAAMLALGKPFWDTEQHFGEPDGNPATDTDWETFVGAAKVINQNYIVAHHTATMFWTPIYSWYDWLTYAGKGLFTANEPWSGHYNTTKTPLWAVAHTTQFTAPGWRYYGLPFNCSGAAGTKASCGLLQGGKEGSFVSYVSPDGAHVTVVIETFGSSSPTPVTLEMIKGEAWYGKPLYKWTSSEEDVFVEGGTVHPNDGTVSLSIPHNQLWTLSTLPTGRKATTTVPPSQPVLPMPFHQNFDNLSDDALAPYFSDMNGAFSAAPRPGGGLGKVLLQQTMGAPPYATHATQSSLYSVAVGSGGWSGYTINVDVFAMHSASTTNYTVYVGSHGGGTAVKPEQTYNSLSAGLVLQLSAAPGSTNPTSWSLSNKGSVLESGRGSWQVAQWAHVVVRVAKASGDGMLVDASVDGQALVKGLAVDFAQGPAYFGCGHHQAAFDNVVIEETKTQQQ